MARIFAYCDSPTAGTGFGRSSQHVLGALHKAGHQITQLAVNHDPATSAEVPWRIIGPGNLGQDPYGLNDFMRVVTEHGPFDLGWVTFDPEVPFSYVLPHTQPQGRVIDVLASFKTSNPGFRLAGWFPIDGGPLSDFELAMLGGSNWVDLAATMSPHVHDLIEWTLKLKGLNPDRAALQKRLHVVPHGVDLAQYRVASDEERREAKRRLGYPADCFLVVQVERNQQRKQVWQALEVVEMLRAMRPKADVRLYQHMWPNEETQLCMAGWNLPELAWRYGLKPGEHVRWRERQFSEQEMVDDVYAAADVTLSVSAGEGFQYPLWEALACGRRVVAPADSARKSWLSDAPGCYLYATRERGIVVRMGYNRRMNFADVTDAARKVTKMIDDRPKHRESPEASREFVAKHAAVENVQRWWVESMARLENEVKQERAASRIADPAGKPADFAVGVRAMPGLGDLTMMGPALRRLREKGSVTLALPRDPQYLQLARWLDVADAYDLSGAPLEQLGREVFNVSSLWAPRHREGWSTPNEHRGEVVARFLGIEPPPAPGLPAPFTAAPPPEAVEQTAARLRQTYGVEPERVVALCLTAGAPGRSLPEAHVKTLVDRLIARGDVPVLLGKQAGGPKTVGALNLTGQTDLGGLLGVLAVARAVIAVDSGPLHFALTMQRPTVALMPLFPASSRLTQYAGPFAAIEPPVKQLGPEQWPPGKDAQQGWAATLQPDAILAALDEVLGTDGTAEEAPRVVMPEPRLGPLGPA